MPPVYTSTAALIARAAATTSASTDDALPDSPPDSSTWVRPRAGLTPDTGDQAPSLLVFVVTVGVLAVYNAVEVAAMTVLNFKHRRGLYFYSVLVSALAIISYTIGRSRYAAITLITIGWWPMVSGQAVVLWSRLHLIVPKGPRGERIVRWAGWMIVINAVVLYLPTTVFTYGSSADGPHVREFARGYDVMQKIQMAGFFCQEVLLSSTYVVETWRILDTSLQPDTRTTMRQLLGINAVIIAMDMGLLILEAQSYYILETMLKGVVYSIKLKLEFVILGKLVSFVGGGQRRGGAGGNYQGAGYGGAGGGGDYDPRKYSVGFVSTAAKRRDRRGGGGEDDDDGMLGNMDHTSEFVDLDRVAGDVTRPSRSTDSRTRSRGGGGGGGNAGLGGVGGGDDDEYDFARFEYAEDVTTLRDSLVGGMKRPGVGVLQYTRVASL